MSLFKTFLVSLALLNSSVTPLSSKNDFYNKLIHALHTANLQPAQISIRSYKNEIEFRLKREDNKYTQVIFSTKKNPYNQVISIVKLFKVTKDKNMFVKFVDLSIQHPYATL